VDGEAAAAGVPGVSAPSTTRRSRACMMGITAGTASDSPPDPLGAPMAGSAEIDKGTVGEWLVASFAASVGAATGPLHPDPGVDLALYRGPMGRAEVQIKTTAKPKIRDGVLRYSLRRQHYEALVCERRIPLRLVVVVTSTQKLRRFRVSRRAVTFPGTALFADPAVTALWNAHGHTIWIPLEQRLTIQILEDWLA